MFRVIVLSLLASLASACSASDFSRDTGVNHTDAPSMLIILRGEIMPGELDAIKKDIESNLDAPPESYGQRLFVLASQGDDADEAMRIGRYIRKIAITPFH